MCLDEKCQCLLQTSLGLNLHLNCSEERQSIPAHLLYTAQKEGKKPAWDTTFA